MIYGGIDPGRHGALVLIGETAQAWALDDSALQALRTHNIVCVGIERVHAMPGQGVVGMFHFGECYGYWQGACAALRVPYRLIPPQTWQRVVLGAPSSDKQRAIEWVRTHYPALNLTPGRRRKPHTGIADACCIAECMRRFLLEADHEPA